MTELINTDSVLNLLNKQFLLNNRDNTTISLINNTFSYSPSINTNINSKINTNINTNLINGNVNGKAQRTLLWNSKRPWNILSSLDYIEDENRNGIKGKSVTTFVTENSAVNNGNSVNQGNKIGISNYDKNGKKTIIVDSEDISEEHDVMSWNNLLKITKKKPEKTEKTEKTEKFEKTEKTSLEKSLLSTTLLNNITKKPAVKDINSSKKAPSSTPSAFTSYLQDLMD